MPAAVAAAAALLLWSATLLLLLLLRVGGSALLSWSLPRIAGSQCPPKKKKKKTERHRQDRDASALSGARGRAAREMGTPREGDGDVGAGGLLWVSFDSPLTKFMPGSHHNPSPVRERSTRPLNPRGQNAVQRSGHNAAAANRCLSPCIRGPKRRYICNHDTGHFRPFCQPAPKKQYCTECGCMCQHKEQINLSEIMTRNSVLEDRQSLHLFAFNLQQHGQQEGQYASARQTRHAPSLW